MTTRDPHPYARSVADSPALALALLALFGAMYAVIARCALDGFPYSGDEYNAVAKGKSWRPQRTADRRAAGRSCRAVPSQETSIRQA
jgi:hypothetical protein